MIEIKTDEYDTIKHYKDGKLHRVDGPAVEFNNGDKFWFFDGKIHNEDGPAMIWVNGFKEWWINGKFIKSENN